MCIIAATTPAYTLLCVCVWRFFYVSVIIHQTIGLVWRDGGRVIIMMTVMDTFCTGLFFIRNELTALGRVVIKL